MKGIYLVWYALLPLMCFSQNISKKCKTCGLTISQCKYKGNHESSSPIVDNSRFYTDYSKVRIGDYFYADGTFSHTLELAKTAIGVVFSTKTSEKDKALGYSHGYIMALKDAKKGRCSWGPEKSDISIIPNYDQCIRNDAINLLLDCNGLYYSRDTNIRRSTNNSFYYVNNNLSINKKRTSGWFVPSVGQWVLFLENLCGVKVEIRGSNYCHIYFDMNKAKTFLKKYNIACDEDYECYWTSNEATDIHAHMIVFSTTQEEKVYSVNKGTTRMRTRGIAAF